MKSTKSRGLDEAILQGIASGIVITDSRGIITQTNRAMEKVFHLERKKVIGKLFWEIFPSWEDENLQKIVLKVLKTGEPYQNERIRYLSMEEASEPGEHTGCPFPEIVFSANINPIFKSERRIIGAVVVLDNLTDKVRLEEHLLKVNEELQKANRVKSDFLSMVSHEMRTPLTLIKMYTSMMADRKLGELTPKQEKALEVMNRRCRNLSDMIGDLLDLSRIEAGNIEMDFEPMDLRKHISLAAANLGYRVLEKELGLFIELEDDLPPVWADRDKFHRVMSNLLENAVKFTDEGGQIRVVAKSWKGGGKGQDGEWVLISVADTGIGIARQEFDKIFQKFYQVDGSDTRKHGGTGLGLSIAKEIVELHNGRIWVESEEGKGTTFFFTLPFAHNGAAVTKFKHVPSFSSEGAVPEQDKQSVSAHGKVTVLLIDDDEDFLAMMNEALEPDAFALHRSNNGIKALDMICGGLKPDIILLDITMPKVSGYELCKILKGLSATHHIPIVMLTASGQEEHIRKGYDAGASGYLVKPFNLDELKSCMDELLTEKAKS
ncbi:MAG: ATP-binding protein [bacterium]